MTFTKIKTLLDKAKKTAKIEYYQGCSIDDLYEVVAQDNPELYDLDPNFIRTICYRQMAGK